MLTYTIDRRDQFRTVESLLMQRLPSAPRGYIHKLIRSNACLLNQSPTVPEAQLIVNDQLTLKESKTVRAHTTGRIPAIDLLWYDERLLIVNKPAGLAMHPAAEVTESLTERGSDWLRDHYHTPHATAYPVNRLDRGTSGVVMLATSSSNAGRFGRYIKEIGLTKCYLALAEGMIRESGSIDLPLDEKESVTRYQVLASSPAASVLLVEPISGRMHQIRRHLQAIGHPIVNDARYGSKTKLNSLGYGIGLHSFTTAFSYPEEQFSLSLTAPIPVTLLDAITQMSGFDESSLFRALGPFTRLTPP